MTAGPWQRTVVRPQTARAASGCVRRVGTGEDAEAKQGFVQRKFPAELKRWFQFIPGVVGGQRDLTELLQEVDIAVATFVKRTPGILPSPSVVLPSSLTGPAFIFLAVGPPLGEQDTDHRSGGGPENTKHRDDQQYPEWRRRHARLFRAASASSAAWPNTRALSRR
jgi:hypothetical protein